MELLNNGLDRTAGEIIRDEWMDDTHPELANTSLVHGWFETEWKHRLSSIGPQGKSPHRLCRTPSHGVSIRNTGYKEVRGEDASLELGTGFLESFLPGKRMQKFFKHSW